GTGERDVREKVPWRLGRGITLSWHRNPQGVGDAAEGAAADGGEEACESVAGAGAGFGTAATPLAEIVSVFTSPARPTDGSSLPFSVSATALASPTVRRTESFACTFRLASARSVPCHCFCPSAAMESQTSLCASI